MISKPVKRSLVEIVRKIRDGSAEAIRREEKKDPEKYRTALLLRIVSAMLGASVEYPFFDTTRRHKSRKVNGKRRNKKAIAVARYYLNPLD